MRSRLVRSFPFRSVHSASQCLELRGPRVSITKRNSRERMNCTTHRVLTPNDLGPLPSIKWEPSKPIKWNELAITSSLRHRRREEYFQFASSVKRASTFREEHAEEWSHRGKACRRICVEFLNIWIMDLLWRMATNWLLLLCSYVWLTLGGNNGIESTCKSSVKYCINLKPNLWAL